MRRRTGRTRWCVMAVLGLLQACSSAHVPQRSPALGDAVAELPPIAYRPTRGVFVVEERIRREQNFGGRRQRTQINRRAFLRTDTVTVPSADGLSATAITVTVDSLVADPGTDVPGTNLGALYEGARGLVFRAMYRRPSQTLDFIGGDSTSQVSDEILGMLQHVFPLMPDDPLRPGLIWTDTTSAVTHATRLALQIHSVAEHRVTGWVPHEEVQALEILSVATYDVVGTEAGQDVKLTGQGTRTARMYIDSAGSLLESYATDSVSMQVRVLSAGISIPVIQTTSITTRREG